MKNINPDNHPLLPKFASKTLPGAKAKAIIARDKIAMSPSLTRDYPFVMERGEGALVWDVDGNRFLDFAAGIAVTATGHSHPAVIDAIKKQADQFVHMSGTDFYYENQVELAERLGKLAPIKKPNGKGSNKVFFTNSGAESIEGAMKLARYKTKRQKFISFYGAFHGRTMGALSLTASKYVQKKDFEPLVPGVHHAFYANDYVCPFDKEVPRTAKGCIEYIKTHIFARVAAPETFAGIIVEPIQGEGGYVVPPADFLPALRALCDEHGIMLICDEVQAGMGRTGKLFATDHFGIKADILCLAKGIASGMPLGAIIAHEDVMCWPYGAHASTFGGNPVACAAALATLDLLQNEYTAHAAKMGDYLMQKLKPFEDEFQSVGQVRGRGLMIGLEIVKNKDKGVLPNPDLRNQIVKDAFDYGLLILGCGANTLRISPPLVITEAQADYLVDTLRTILKTHS